MRAERVSRILSILWIVSCLAACRAKEAAAPTPVAAAKTAPAAPARWETRLAALPDPAAEVDGVPIARAALGADLRAAVDGGVLAPDADAVTFLRSAATSLESHIDALLVAHALTPDQRTVALRAATAELQAEQATRGGKAPWLTYLRLRGQTEAMQLDVRTTAQGLALLVAGDPSVQVPAAEVQERFELQNKSLVAAGHSPLTFEAARGNLQAALARSRLFSAGRRLLAQLRAQARIMRAAPLDHPPGGLPLSGAVTAAEPEPDDD